MRQMGDKKWQWLIFAIPLIAVALSIQYFLRKTYPEPANPDQTVAMKPSAFKTEEGKNGKKSRKGAMKEKEMASKEMAKSGGDMMAAAPSGKSKGHSVAGAHKLMGVDESGDSEKMNGGMSSERAPANDTTVGAPKMASNMSTSSVGVTKLEFLATGTNPKTGDCTSIEFRGEGPQQTKISKAEWDKVVKAFHDSKGELLTWLKSRKKELPDKTVKMMETQMRQLKLQRPPTLEEPDLAWRGVGVWTYDNAKNPLIKLGGGFVKLMNKQPKRAKFELTRLMAQSWAPCELQRLGAADAWTPLLKCLDISEDQACGAGTYSESGWAVSSTIASHVSAPECHLPAFYSQSAFECMKKIPLPLTMAETTNESWKEARR